MRHQIALHAWGASRKTEKRQEGERGRRQDRQPNTNGAQPHCQKPNYEIDVAHNGPSLADTCKDKSMVDIFYATFYGSTQQYADELARRLGTSARAIPEQAELTGPTVVLAPIHGPVSAGASFLRQQPLEVLERYPVALVTVGMSLDEVAREKDTAAKLLGKSAAHVTRFYLPGRLNYSSLSTPHSATMRGVISALRLKPRKSANDQMMIDTFGKDVDRVDLTRLDAIEAWARG